MARHQATSHILLRHKHEQHHAQKVLRVHGQQQHDLQDDAVSDADADEERFGSSVHWPQRHVKAYAGEDEQPNNDVCGLAEVLVGDGYFFLLAQVQLHVGFDDEHGQGQRHRCVQPHTAYTAGMKQRVVDVHLVEHKQRAEEEETRFGHTDGIVLARHAHIIRRPVSVVVGVVVAVVQFQVRSVGRTT